MPCTNCGLHGHNKRTCLQNIKHLDDICINSSQHIKQKTNNINNCIEECVICLCKIKEKLETPCKHKFCSKCIFKNISHGNFNCPLCRKQLVKPKIPSIKKYKRT